MNNALSASLLAFLSLALAAGHADAQELTLNRFQAAETTEDGFQLSRPDGFGHLRPSAQLHLDYAHDPLVYDIDRGADGDEIGHVVENQLTANVGLAFGLWDRLVVFAGLPVNLWVDGDGSGEALGLAQPEGAGLGDMYLGARGRLFGERDDFFGLGAQATLTLPTGGGSYGGDSFLTFHPELLMELRPGPVRITSNMGVRITENQQLQGDVEIGDQVTFALGLTVPVYGTHLEPGTTRVDLHAQLFGATGFGESFFQKETTPLEALAGAKLHHESGFVGGLSVGGGLTRGVGSPDARVIATFGWALPEERVPAAAPAPAAAPRAEEPAPAAEPAPGDTDGDGILDDVDQCVTQPEDADGFEDEDGCPDPDNDEDGVMDQADECPMEAGPVVNRGCPDSDRDGDGLVDRVDNCPDEAGPESNRGCLAEQQVVIEEGRLQILDKVYFRTNRAQIQPRSFPLLTNVAEVLVSHPDIDRVRVEGHTDSTGNDAYNLRLSRERAASVRDFLIEHGVDPNRLTAQGFGETRPLANNGSAEGRAANRRVEFNLGEEAPAATTE